MATEGKLELTIKINEFPTDVTTAENAWKSFDLDCDGRIFSVSFRPKVFKKFEDAQANFPMWVAAISESTSNRPHRRLSRENPTSR